jgi:hypothetical protein
VNPSTLNTLTTKINKKQEFIRGPWISRDLKRRLTPDISHTEGRDCGFVFSFPFCF